MNRLFRKFIALIQYVLVLLFILFEELIWEGVAEPIYGYIRSLRILRRLERVIAEVNRYLLLGIFVALFVAVELAGIAAGVLMVRGMGLYGLGLYALKIPIAAFTFWLFRVSREKLLSFGWFRWSYEKILAFTAWLKALPIYRDTMEKLHRLRESLKKLAASLKRYFGEKRSDWSKRFKRLYLRIRNSMRKRDS
jgi:hypothetical protein